MPDHGSLRSRRHALRAAALLPGALVARGGGAADRPASLPEIDERFAAALDDLVRRCRRVGQERLADLVAAWPLPAAAGRQQIVAIAESLAVPEWLEGDLARGLWDDFIAARRAHADGLFAAAAEAARAHAATPRRGTDTAAAPPWPDQGCEAIRLLHLALRDDPSHARARRAGGWVERAGRWVLVEVDRRLDRGEDYDPAFGWLPRGRLTRYRAGERYDLGRWVDAVAAEQRERSLQRPLRFESDHWRIATTADLTAAAELARTVEETWAAWQQAFGAYRAEPTERERWFEGRGRPPVVDGFAATLVRDRDEYVRGLESVEPAVGRTDGMYWAPTKTAWFIAAADADAAAETARTVRHECTHQLFAETRPISRLAGERVGFWAIEAAACYMESLVATPYGWTLGGPDAGRMPAARERVLEDGFQVPLGELAGLGRREFQADQRLAPIYSQISGLADFFMNGRDGRYRAAFIEYLVRVYTGTATADSLEKLCDSSHAELDEQFRRHLAAADSAAAAVR